VGLFTQYSPSFNFTDTYSPGKLLLVRNTPKSAGSNPGGSFWSAALWRRFAIAQQAPPNPHIAIEPAESPKKGRMPSLNLITINLLRG
jgi:hypothetical protein